MSSNKYYKNSKLYLLVCIWFLGGNSVLATELTQAEIQILLPEKCKMLESHKRLTDYTQATLPRAKDYFLFPIIYVTKAAQFNENLETITSNGTSAFIAYKNGNVYYETARHNLQPIIYNGLTPHELKEYYNNKNTSYSYEIALYYANDKSIMPYCSDSEYQKQFKTITLKPENVNEILGDEENIDPYSQKPHNDADDLETDKAMKIRLGDWVIINFSITNQGEKTFYEKNSENYHSYELTAGNNLINESASFIGWSAFFAPSLANMKVKFEKNNYYYSLFSFYDDGYAIYLGGGSGGGCFSNGKLVGFLNSGWPHDMSLKQYDDNFNSNDSFNSDEEINSNYKNMLACLGYKSTNLFQTYNNIQKPH